VVDERVVATKLEQIEQYHRELRSKQSLSRETFLSDTTEQRAVERMFENAIQACADLAQHIATHGFGFEKETSKGAVRLLGREGVIDEETATTLVAAVGFRNEQKDCVPATRVPTEHTWEAGTRDIDDTLGLDRE